VLSFFSRLFTPNKGGSDPLLADAIRSITGKRPNNLDLFRLAILHSSVAKQSKQGFRESNERLEYLGDAVLGMVIAEFLFKKFPYKNEGFLTEIRSRIVNRESLNILAKKMGINAIVEYQDKQKKNTKPKTIYGNALEAFIGAVYLDRGYYFCQKFILDKLVADHLNLEEVITTESNYKSKIIEWSQKENKQVVFETLEMKSEKQYKQFKVQLLVDGEAISLGHGTSKKRAEQQAAHKACGVLKID